VDTARLPTENSKKKAIPLNLLMPKCYDNDKDQPNIKIVAKTLLVNINFVQMQRPKLTLSTLNSSFVISLPLM